MSNILDPHTVVLPPQQVSEIKFQLKIFGSDPLTSALSVSSKLSEFFQNYIFPYEDRRRQNSIVELEGKKLYDWDPTMMWPVQSFKVKAFVDIQHHLLIHLYEGRQATVTIMSVSVAILSYKDLFSKKLLCIFYYLFTFSSLCHTTRSVRSANPVQCSGPLETPQRHWCSCINSYGCYFSEKSYSISLFVIT